MFFEEEELQVVSLIECRESAYHVNAETMEWLASHDAPFAVVACAGKYRTGKSFLLNRLAKAKANCGFGVGDSVQACTKGLWIYKKFLPVEGGCDVLLMDTEGIDALDADDTHDVRIFTMALLLCSTFLYNSVGHIDEAALQTLSLMSRVTQNVRVGADEALSLHMPRFYWVLRDFSLRIVSRDGKALSPDEYLEEALNATNGARCDIREAIREAFPTRHLVTLQRPSIDDSNNQRLEDRSLCISPKFVQAVDAIRSRLFDEAAPLQANAVTLSGKMYVEMCKYYAEAVQSKRVPVIRDSWTLMSAVHARDLKDSLLAQYDETVKTLQVMTTGALRDILDKECARLQDRFERESMRPVDTKVCDDLRAELVSRYEATVLRLGKDSHEIARGLLGGLESAARDGCLLEKLDTVRARFVAECRGDDELWVWHDALAVALVDRGIPTLIATHRRAYDEVQTQIEQMRSDVQLEQHKVQQCAKEAFRAASMQTEELRRQAETEKVLREGAETETRRLQEELRAAHLEIRTLHTVQEASDQDESEAFPADAPVETEEIDQTDYAAMASTLRNDLDDKLVQIRRLSDEVDRQKTTHANVERSFNEGLVQLRRDCDVQRAKAKHAYDELQIEVETRDNTIRELRYAIKLEEQKRVQASEAHERELDHSKHQIVTGQQQCELSQKRVIDIHQEMLDGIVQRDERYRTDQAKMFSERVEAEGKITDAVRVHEQARSDIRELKRQLNDAQRIDRDNKRLKLANDDCGRRLVRMEADLDHASQENDRLHERNMHIEHNLARVNAEKHLAEARCAVNNV